MAQRIKEEDLRLNLIINGDETRKRMNDIRSELSKTKISLTALEKERKNLAKTSKEGSAELVILDKKIEAHRAAIKNLNASYKDQERRLSINGMSMKELSMHARNLNAVLRNLTPGTADWKKYNNELLLTKKRMTELKGESAATAGAMKGMLTGLAAKAMGIYGVLSGIFRVFGGAANTIKDFEQENANLATILGISVQEMSDLTDEALRLGSTTRYTASQVTALQTELAKLGFSKTQIKVMEEPVLNFATAVGAELPEAAALAGSALRMFNLRTTDTEDTLGALALSTNKSALNFGFLQTALSIVGPVANTFGFSIKDTIALLGSLANAGFDASSAATATRNILLNLADANGDLAKALGGPVKTFDELIDGLEQLNSKGIDLAGTLELTDKRSVSAFNSFLAGAEKTAELRGELELTDGALKEIAERRMDTFAGASLRAQSAWEGFVLELRGSSGILKNVTDALAGMISMLTDWVSGGKVRHNNSVDTLVEDLRFAHETEEQAYEEASVKMAYYEKQATVLREQIAEESNKKQRKRLEKQLKEMEEYASRYKDAMARLNVVSDEEEAGGSPGPGSGNTPGGAPGAGAGSGSGDNDKKAWSLQNDKAYLQAKTALTQQFIEGQIKTQEEFDEALYQVEIASYKARLAAGKESGVARAKIESEMQTAILKHTQTVQKKNEQLAQTRKKEAEEVTKLVQAAQQTFIQVTEDHKLKADAQEKAEEERYQKELQQYEAKKGSIKDYQKVVEVLKIQHQNNLRKIQLEYVAATQKDLEASNKKRIAEIQAEYAYELSLTTTTEARKREIQRTIAQQTAQENAKYLFEQVKMLEEIVRKGEVGGISLSTDQLKQYETMLAQLRKQLGEAIAQTENLESKGLWENIQNMFTGTGNGSLFGVSQSDWEQFFANLEQGTMGAKDLGTIINGIGGFAQEGMKIATKAVNALNAQEKKAFDDWSKANDKKKEQLKQQLDAGLMSESQYNAEIERMEAEKAAKEEEMKTQQAQRQKTMSIIQATINTALGVTQTLAQWGLPWGLIPAAAMAAMGAAEIALIASQPAGYEGGGEVDVTRKQDGKPFRAKVRPNKRGLIDEPTILVAENGPEYVIPKDGVTNPSIAPILETIETARRRGTLKSLNLEAAHSSSVRGYVDGGMVGGTIGTAAAGGGSGTQIPTKLIPAMEKLADRFDELSKRPIEAQVRMLGRGGLEETMDRREKQKKGGKFE